MKKYFKISFIHQLTYTEYYGMITEIMDRINQPKIKEEGVLTFVRNVERHIPKLGYVVERTRLHKNTAKINDIAKERDQTFSSLVHGIKAGQHAETQEQRDAWRVLNSWLRQEKKVRRSQSVIRRSAMFSRMNIRVQDSEAKQQALRTLRLTARLEKIMNLTEEIWELRGHRIKDLGAFTMMSHQLRQNSHKDLVMMLRMMEAWANMEGEHQKQMDFTCKMVGATMKETDRILKFRKTMAKKAEEKKNKKSGLEA